jgi:hypothetical protein
MTYQVAGQQQQHSHSYSSSHPDAPIQHTAGHVKCPACERAVDMQQGGLSPELLFTEAFDIWIAQRVIDHQGVWSNARYISKRTESDLRQYKRAAEKFFSGLRLDQIHVGHLREYHKARATNLLHVAAGETHPWERPCGAPLIRKEVGLVIGLMKAAGAWTEHHVKFYEPLQVVESDVPRALAPEEQHRWLHVAASRIEWRIVYWWSIVALQTTASTNELRGLRLGDIDLTQGYLQIRTEGAKNKYRVRTIPFASPDIVYALGGLIERARAMGASGPHCYLFPIHVSQKRYDPLEQMTKWAMRKKWNEVRSASGLDWLEPRDLRHCAITRMAEAGANVQMIMSFAGHVSRRMQQHYTAISMTAKRRWAAAAFMGGEMPYAPMGGSGMQMPSPPPMGPAVTGPIVAGMAHPPASYGWQMATPAHQGEPHQVVPIGPPAIAACPAWAEPSPQAVPRARRGRKPVGQILSPGSSRVEKG